MRKIAHYWRLAFLPLALTSLWTAHVCVTQFEPVRRSIVMITVLTILLIIALVLLGDLVICSENRRDIATIGK
jgi:hypothetical protein